MLANSRPRVLCVDDDEDSSRPRRIAHALSMKGASVSPRSEKEKHDNS